MRIGWLAAAIVWCIPVASAQAQVAPAPLGSLLLAEGGRARLAVVISPKAPEPTKAVAAELAQYLGKIAGATFEVTSGDASGGGIVLGTLAEFPDEALAKPLAVRGFDG